MGCLIDPENYMLPRELSVSFTGHRLRKLPWGADERDLRCIDFKRRLEEEIIKAYDEGARYFLSGMADGVDIYAAEAVLSLSRSREGMKLVCVFPYGRGSDLRTIRCASKAFAVVSVCGAYSPGCFQKRNSFLVKHSRRIICGYSGDLTSGTAATIRLAIREGITPVIINID